MTATSTEVTLSPKTKAILHQSILNYLHRSGFTKTLKRFQSEAQIQNDTWKTSSANLEDIYCKYINDSCQPKDNVVETKAKKKKKNKQDLASVDDDIVNGLEVKESKKKSKDKKKSVEENEDDAKKSSKKRKRLLSDENGHQTVEEVPKQNYSNEKLEMNGVEKSVKKQRVGSAEPKTVNAFQRVKIDQVEFAHEKLQDNSYWAKDGADVGYGAKAQEVLGQVRGRGFRHEKTKKKRGSYRGGQIDLQSHSVKFNYSDEE